jgi:hypothetical protein
LNILSYMTMYYIDKERWESYADHKSVG